MTTHDFDYFADALGVAGWKDRDTGNRSAMMPCPIHGGSDSLHVTERSGKTALTYCFVCGKDASRPDQVADAVSLGAKIKPPKPSAKSKARRVEAGRETFDYGTAKKTRIDYADGAKPEKMFLWDPVGTKPDSLLYGVEAFSADEPVVLVEGERKRDALKAAGAQAVSLAGGSSSKPTDAALMPLSDLTVVLWADNDEPGRKVMDRVARSLRGIASEVRIIEWPDAPPKGDAADFLASPKADVRALINAAQPWAEADDDDYLAEWASDVSLTAPEPLLLDYLEPNDFSILFGDGGVGKGMVAAQWVADLTNDGWIVVLLDYEQNTVMEWIPRVERFGGQLDRLRVLQFEGAIWDHADRVAADITASREARDGAPVYVVVDSIGYAVGDAKIESSDTAVKYKKALLRIARGHPVLSLAHTTKTDVDARYPFGSKFWHNNVRHTIGVYTRGDAEDAPRVLRNRKVNRRSPFEAAEIDWSWVFGDPPARLVFRTAGKATASRVIAILTKGPKTVTEIVADANEDGDEPVTAGAVKRLLERGDEFTSDGKKPATWTYTRPIAAPRPSAKRGRS